MPEPFKDQFNKKIIRKMAAHFAKHCPKKYEFREKAFIADASRKLDELELKARSEQITQAMIEYLPDDYCKAGQIILASLNTKLADDIGDATVDDNGIAGWAIMPMTHYVGRIGHQDFELSMKLLKEMTKGFSSEFGIRFFLLSDTEKTLGVLAGWAHDKNRHVRRLASEGSRPRLPWAMQLPQFIKDPAPVISLLDVLKDDEDAYVRRSVANHLNDIAKDHPDVVADIAARWMPGSSKERQQLLRHACRTLIKGGHKKTLKVFGFGSPKLASVDLCIDEQEIVFGESLGIELLLCSSSRTSQSLVVDYVIHHQKANGSTSPKVFKWRNMSLSSKDSVTLRKKHAIKPISTRVYYPGLHKIEIMVNGESVAEADFQLRMD